MPDLMDDLPQREETTRPAREATREARRERRRAAAAGRSRGRRWGLRLLAVLVALVFLAVALVAGFAIFLNQKVEHNVTHEPLLPAQVAGPTPTPSTPEEAAAQAQIEASKGLNVLLIGTDTRPGDVGRSDVMVLAHIPEDHSKVYLVHFPRDLWVSIPGRGQAKLNAAYAYGGAPLLVQSLQNLIGVRVDHVAKTDFAGFQRMVDAVGGVSVYAEEASNGTGNGGSHVFQQGWNDVNGEQALEFVRERYNLSQGDISRGKRQQALIKAIMMKTISPEVITNPVRIAQFTDAATSNLVVDESLTTAFMREQALALRNVRSGDVVFITAPFTGYGWSSDGQSIDVVDQAGMQALGDAIRQDRLGDYKRTSVIP